jgi:hypothetical protein
MGDGSLEIKTALSGRVRQMFVKCASILRQSSEDHFDSAIASRHRSCLHLVDLLWNCQMSISTSGEGSGASTETPIGSLLCFDIPCKVVYVSSQFHFPVGGNEY